MTKERKQEIIATYRRDEKGYWFSRSSNSSFNRKNQQSNRTLKNS